MSEQRFSSVILVDERGWILLQERDEFPEIDPEKWGFVGGHLEAGEDFETGAYRELEEETGVRLPAGTLDLWGEFRPWPGSDARMQLWVARTTLSDADLECHEGRQIVFVEPAVARGLDLGGPPSAIVPAFLDSAAYATLAR